MMKLALPLLLATATLLVSCGRENVSSAEVERDTRRALDKGERYLERKADRTASALSDRFARFDANAKDVNDLRGEHDVRDGVDEALAVIEQKAKLLKSRFTELASDSAAGASQSVDMEWQQLERELDQLQQSLDNIAREIRADLR